MSKKSFSKKRYKPVVLKRIMSADKNTDDISIPRFATIDIETQDWTKYVCGEIYWINDEGQEEFFETNCPYQLMLKCFELKLKYGIDNFVAHYGGKFDFLFFMKTFCDNMGFEVGSIIPRGPSILSFEATLRYAIGPDGKPDFFSEPIKITFRDSSGLLSYSLGSLTKSFNVETLKGEMDFLFIEDVYYERDYMDKILKDDRCSLFWRGRQVFKLTKNQRASSNRDNFRYWNHERYYFFPHRGAKKKLAPYPEEMRKKDAEAMKQITFPIFKKEHLLLYLHHDCKSLYQCLIAWFNAPLINVVKKKWTVASQAVEVFKLFAPRDLHSLPDDEKWFEGDVDGFVRKAYFGGRTEVIKPIFLSGETNKHKELFYYDVNSLYPFCMARFSYGNKFLRWANKSNLEKDYKNYPMSIWTAKVRVPLDMYLPPLPVKSQEHEDRLIFPVGEFTGHWTRYEIEYAKSLGVEVLELVEGALFEDAGKIFEPFVNTLYNMRKEAKKNKDHVAQMSMKLLMNSCYGKMGQNKVQEKIIIDDGTRDDVSFLTEINMPDGTTLRLGTVPDKSEKMYSNPAIACFVTSYARVHLHKQFMIVDPKNVYYCDTDSVFSGVMMPTGDEVGQMKLEATVKDSAVFLLPKTYVMEGLTDEEKGDVPLKLTMKGFDYKNIRNRFTVDDFLLYLEGDRSRIFATEKPKFATFKTALRMGTFLTMKNDPAINRANDERKEREYALNNNGKKKKYVKKEYNISVKRLRGSYTKRIITDDGYDTKPIILGTNGGIL